MAGLRLPIVTHPLQAFVTEAYKPVLDRIVASQDLLVYVSQSARGELLAGAEIERYPSYSTRSTFTFLSEASARCIDLFPSWRRLRVLRQWTGVCDMTPDYSPLMGTTEVEGFYLNAGWGTWGFKATPIAGVSMAELVATGEGPTSHRPVCPRPLSTRPSLSRSVRPRVPTDGPPPGRLLGYAAAVSKMPSGRNAPTTQFGASTTS